MERSARASATTRTVALLTDFGLADPYVGQMKGVLARLAPQARLVDLTHGVAPFNLAQGGFFLAASAPHFPEDAVFLAVVDPGVGTARRIVAVERRRQTFLAPDNGLLGLILDGPEPVRAFDLTPDPIVLNRVSPTFQARDVFAPLAASLALGRPAGDLGTATDPAGLARGEWSRPELGETAAKAHVLHVDRFGNCALNLREGCRIPAEGLRLLLPGPRPIRRVRTYADLAAGEVGLLAGSQGFLELAVNMGSAARSLGLGPGAAVSLAWG